MDSDVQEPVARAHFGRRFHRPVRTEPRVLGVDGEADVVVVVEVDGDVDVDPTAVVDVDAGRSSARERSECSATELGEHRDDALEQGDALGVASMVEQAADLQDIEGRGALHRFAAGDLVVLGHVGG